MSDLNDRGRRRKKRVGPIGSERDDEGESSQPGKTMIILSKPHSERPSSTTPDTTAAPSSPTRISEPKQPTVLLKARDYSERDASSRATSPAALHGTGSGASGGTSQGSKEENLGGGASASQVYHIQQKHGQSTLHESTEQKLAPPPEMTAPVKLIDDSLLWCDNAMEYLLDQTDFYVVGVIGLQGVGKSTVLSIVSGHSDDGGSRPTFKIQTREMRELGEHCTIGIDMYVTSERLILLDTQPVLSSSVMDRMVLIEKKVPTAADYYSTENALYMQSLQIASFLMAVAHTVIIVQDWFVDPHFLRFIQSAEMLKPGTPTNTGEMSSTSEESQEYYPHIVFVQNKCQCSDFLPSSVKDMKNVLRCIFARSKLKHKGSVVTDGIMEKEGSEAEVNLFLLPEKELSDQGNTAEDIPRFRGHKGLNQIYRSLSSQILSMPRSNLTHASLTEKNWFHYAARTWETVKKSNLFHEYSRLLP